MQGEFENKPMGTPAFRIPSLPAGHQLEAFVAVAEHGRLSAAARRLHIAQSTLSRQMEQLERALDCQLLVRTHSGTRLTLPGEIFYGYARRILSELAEVRHQMEAAGRGQVLHLATVTGPLYTVLPAAVADFERLEQCRVLVEEAATDDIGKSVRSRQSDLGIANLPLGEGLQFDVLTESELALAVPADHPLAGERQIELARVRNEPFILLSRDQTLNRLAVSACHAAGFSPRARYHTRDIHLCIHLVSQRAGVSIVPHTRALARLTPDVRFVAIQPPLKRTLAAVYVEATPLVGKLVAHLQGVFRAD